MTRVDTALARPPVQVVRVAQNERVSVVELRGTHFAVVSTGAQGPPGVVSEQVLARLEAAEVAAAQAVSVSTEASKAITSLVQELSGTFDYYAGVTRAQEG